MRVVIALVLAVVLAGTASANLLLNSDLSTPATAGQINTLTINNWTSWGSDGWYQTDIDSDWSVKFWGTGAGMFQDWDCTADGVYTFTVQAYQTLAEQLTTESAYLKVEWYNSDYSTQLGASTLDSLTGTDPVASWNTLSGTATAVVGAVHGRVVLGLEGTEGSGAAFFDDATVDLQAIPEPASALLGLLGVGLVAILRRRTR